MTEFQIFKTILKKVTDKQFDFPKLQEDSVEIIADTFSNIIYESLKQKSSASTIKRGNVLKFINKLCAVKQPHIEKSASDPFLKATKKFYVQTNCEEIQNLQNEIESELERTCDLRENIQRFFKRKNDIQSTIGSRIDSIKQLDQEDLKLKYQLQPRKVLSHFEVTEEVIQKVTENLCDSHRNESPQHMMDSLHFREKQIKLGYAWMNLNEDKTVMEKILSKLAKYETLEVFEENFLFAIWRLNGEDFLYYMNIISENFYFIIERIIIESCIKIIAMNQQDAEKCLVELQDEENFTKIKMICSKIALIRHKLHSLINDLYILGFCNENLWKLHTFI